MAILKTFYRYLEHFGRCVPVHELVRNPNAKSICALRHDVDHDLDVALEMAFWEHEAGVRTTYYLLPTAPYWKDERLIEKALQLQDYGHEVGLHVNIMAQWVNGDIHDPAIALRSQLDLLRQGGVNVTGIAAHGDKVCYQHNISNYWCFNDLRPHDPANEENGRTAEGPYDTSAKARHLKYPKEHVAVREDGSRYPLWSIAMNDLGIEYHAWHTPFDQYFSDSGGDWVRTSNPLKVDRGNDRWQVLIHPIHWRAPPRVFFFLSPARSGSKWLSEMLGAATPLETRHEYILNQEYHSGESRQKATSAFRALEDEPARVAQLLCRAWEEVEQLKSDFAEVNVYLPFFLNELQRYFPDATLVHLKRNPAHIVRSLMQRDWYDTPADHAHPQLRSQNLESMSQFERVCEYVADASERLLAHCHRQISLELITADYDALASELRDLGIPFHKRLGESSFKRVINGSRRHDFPPASEWTADQNKRFIARLQRTGIRLGYGHQFGGRFAVGRAIVSVGIRSLLRRMISAFGTAETVKIRELPALSIDPGQSYGENCDVTTASTGIVMQRKDSSRHAYMTAGGSRWHGCFQPNGLPQGWVVKKLAYIKGRVVSPMQHGRVVNLWALMYGADGKQIHKRQLVTLDNKQRTMEFAFAVHPHAERFDIAVFLSKAASTGTVTIGKIEIQYKV